MSTFTDNYELIKQAAGENVGTWGDPVLNAQMIQRVDDALGKTTTVALSASPVTLTQSQWQTKALSLTGTITANIVISLPLSVNSVGSATAVGGEFIVNNQTTGAFTVTVQTAATASTGVQVPQGYRSVLYSDAINVTFSDDQSRSTVLTNAGNPNGSVAGTAGSLNTPASLTLDRSAGILYACTTGGDASTAVHSPLTGATPPVCAYVTASADQNNVILTGDSIGATTIYVSNYGGNTCPVNNGSYFVPVPFSQLPLVLTASQSSLNLYDVVFFLNGSTPTVGFSPSWLAGTGGSVTAGSCARGTGIGGAAIQRVGGVWQNTAAMTVNNGVTTYTVPALRGTILATIFVDSSAGHVTCHRTYGQSRKWGVWNFSNRQNLYLKAGDPTASWVYATSTYRASNGNSANSLTILQGVAEEEFDNSFIQNFFGNTGVPIYTGIGVNSTSSPSGLQQQGTPASASFSPIFNGTSRYLAPPSLGINVITSLEKGLSAANFIGTEASMLLSSTWRG